MVWISFNYFNHPEIRGGFFNIGVSEAEPGAKIHGWTGLWEQEAGYPTLIRGVNFPKVLTHEHTQARIHTHTHTRTH